MKTHCKNGHALTEDNIYRHKGSAGRRYPACRTCRLETGVRYTRRIKLEVIAHYGGKCACCGEARQEFLAVDHIDGGGRRHTKKLGKRGSQFHKWLKAQGYPEGYRVLCHNCNMALGHFGYCPHQKSKTDG